VLAVERAADGPTFVTVLPVTHSAPAAVGDAVEIPAAIKRHLGLDQERSWMGPTQHLRCEVQSKLAA